MPINITLIIQRTGCMWPMLLLAPALIGCGNFTGSLFNYPHEAKAESYTYYDPDFKANNSPKIAASKLQLAGYYLHHDTTSFIYNEYERNKVIHKRGTSYNYFKFLDDGRVVNIPTINPPGSAIHNSLKSAPWFSTGRYRIDGDTIYIELKNELEGNKSYFSKALAYENGIRVFFKPPKKPLRVVDYQYLTE